MVLYVVNSARWGSLICRLSLVQWPHGLSGPLLTETRNRFLVCGMGGGVVQLHSVK